MFEIQRRSAATSMVYSSTSDLLGTPLWEEHWLNLQLKLLQNRNMEEFTVYGTQPRLSSCFLGQVYRNILLLFPRIILSKTAQFIYSVLKKLSPFRDYLSYLLASLCENVQAGTPPQLTMINQMFSVYCPRDVVIPSDNTGFVYLLISTVDLQFLCIGSCYNLIARYSSHNTGFGSFQTAPASLRPWAILCYVSGFEGQRRHFLDFERRWIAQKVALQRQPHSQASIEAIVALGETIALKFNEDRHMNLKFINSGTITSLREAVPTITVYSSSTESENKSSSSSEDQINSNSESETNDAELDFSASASDNGYDPSESSDAYENDDENDILDEESDSSVDGPYTGDSDSDHSCSD